MDKRDELQEEWSNRYVKSERRSILNLAPRTGKIRTSILIFNKLDITTEEVLIAYPDNKIEQSWIDDFEKFKYYNPNVIFTNFSSLRNHVRKTYRMFIIDEIHELSEKELIACNYIMDNSDYNLALSGTISPQTEKMLSKHLDLNILIRYSIEDAIRDKIIADYRIQVHVVKLDTSILHKNSKGIFKTEKKSYDNYTFVIDKFKKEGKNTSFLILNRHRIIQSSISKIRKIKSLLDLKESKRFLVFTGLQKISENLGIHYYHSNSKNDASFEMFMEGRINKLAMVNIGGVGATYKPLDGVIISNFTFNSEKTEQILARALVLDYKDKVANLHIITTDEPIEMDKLKETLKGLNQKKIEYYYE